MAFAKPIASNIADKPPGALRREFVLFSPGGIGRLGGVGDVFMGTAAHLD